MTSSGVSSVFGSSAYSTMTLTLRVSPGCSHSHVLSMYVRYSGFVCWPMIHTRVGSSYGLPTSTTVCSRVDGEPVLVTKRT